MPHANHEKGRVSRNSALVHDKSGKGCVGLPRGDRSLPELSRLGNLFRGISILRGKWAAVCQDNHGALFVSADRGLEFIGLSHEKSRRRGAYELLVLLLPDPQLQPALLMKATTRVSLRP